MLIAHHLVGELECLAQRARDVGVGDEAARRRVAEGRLDEELVVEVALAVSVRLEPVDGDGQWRT